ncbi:hypothetical protein C8R46DRAFT_1132143 [Mycena filopes]|nr:hypothetical protein C8R46DRAFT_1132143 [Mycena filopes]
MSTDHDTQRSQTPAKPTAPKRGFRIFDFLLDKMPGKRIEALDLRAKAASDLLQASKDYVPVEELTRHDKFITELDTYRTSYNTVKNEIGLLARHQLVQVIEIHVDQFVLEAETATQMADKVARFCKAQGHSPAAGEKCRRCFPSEFVPDSGAQAMTPTPTSASATPMIAEEAVRPVDVTGPTSPPSSIVRVEDVVVHPIQQTPPTSHTPATPAAASLSTTSLGIRAPAQNQPPKVKLTINSNVPLGEITVNLNISSQS